MDLASPAVSGTSVYANGLRVLDTRTGMQGRRILFSGGCVTQPQDT